MVIGGHDWVGGWRKKERKRRKIRSVGERTSCIRRKGRVMKRTDASSVASWGPQTTHQGKGSEIVDSDLDPSCLMTALPKIPHQKILIPMIDSNIQISGEWQMALS